MSTRARTRAATAAAAAAVSASSATSPFHAPPTNPTLNSKSSPTKGKRKSNTKDTTTSTSVKQQQEQSLSATAADSSAEKENIKAASTTATTTRSSTTKKHSQSKSKATPKVNVPYCTCSKGDDGSPMIRCAECNVWYHFICVDLSEHEAEEINVYICSPCTQSTGRKTAMVWEGIDALEDCGSEEETASVTAKPIDATNAVTPTTKINTVSATAAVKQKPKKPTVTVSLLPPPPRPQTPSDESDGAGSADDYVAEDEETKGSSKTKGKRRLRRISSSDSGSSSEAEEAVTTTRTSRRNRPPIKLRKLSSPRSQTPVSPALASATTPTTSTSNKSLSRLKRKSSIAEKDFSAPAPKRKKSDAGGGGGTTGDPVRKYCLSKFEEVFKEVFLRYPYTRATASSIAGEISETGDVKLEEAQVQAPSSGPIVMKKLEELSEEEKESLIEDSKHFAAELEQCVFDIYSEGDAAGAKYKDRFRTLQFNLSKPDRIAVHQRIIKRTITPKEISLMSSTDLADEETKQHIKIAEKESLEQTILQKPIVPRAKITHKGLQDIEDVHGDLARAREVERLREREQEEEERRERERRERLRAVEKQQQQHQRQRTQSLSVPPESPVVPSHSPVTADQQQAWGAPPPVPAHILQQQQGTAGSTDDILSSPIRPLFAHTISDVVMTTAPEPELNLADLINIDEDGTDQDANNASTSGTGAAGGAGVAGGPESSGDVNSTTAAMNITSSSGVPAPPPLEQPIEPDGGVSGKHPGAHHTMSGLAHLTVSPTSPTTPSSSSIVSPFSATRPRGLSFDLNSLWQSAPKDENDISRTPRSPVSHQHQDQGSPSVLLGTDKGTIARVGGGGESSVDDSSSGAKRSILHGIGGEPGVGGVRDLVVMEPEPMEVANDDDFDMFLAEEKEDVVDRSGSRGITAGSGSTTTGTAVPSETATSEAEPCIPQDPEAAFEAIQQCWTGKVHMPLDAAAPQTTTVAAKQIGGRSLGHQSPWWKILFPSEELRIDGRVNTKSSEDFLTQTRLNQHRELVAVAFTSVSEEMKADFVALIEYLKERDRHGLIFPWGHRPKDTCPGREMYLVPLRAKEPLPEYIELLDELKIPKTRETDLLIGIWILYRGRLNHPPQPTPTSTGVSATAVPPTVPTPATPIVPAPPMPNIPPLPPHLASAKSQSPSISTPSQNPTPVPNPISAPSTLPQPTPGLPPQINQAALAAEVASLTPDQVQNLLRTLTASNLPFPINLPAPSGSGTSAAPQPPLISSQPHGTHPPPPPPPPPPSHPWPGYPIPGGPPSSQPPGGYPPPPSSMYGHSPPPSHSHSYPPPPPPLPGPSDHDRRDSYGSPHSYYAGGRSGDRERGERSGWRGGGGNRNQRGRGKHRGGGGGNAASRPVDSGWPRRSRNDDGNSSPGRRWG